MLVELAVGDAYGFGFKNIDARYLAANKLKGYLLHPMYLLDPGSYTEGTQMAIALSELILADAPWTRESIAEKFVEVYRRDRRKVGYPGSSRVLARATTGRDLLELSRGKRRDGGAAMRAGPVGVLEDVEEVVERTRIQASVTHGTRCGTNAAIASALMTHYFLHDRGTRANLHRYIAARVKGDWGSDHSGAVKANGLQCVHAAITAIRSCKDRISNLLRRCVAFGGDTNTVSAIALASGSCCPEIFNDLPDPLVERLEWGEYGLHFIDELDLSLLQMAGKEDLVDWRMPF